MNNRKRITEYLIPALVAGVLFLIILAVNGLWPFGKATIDYYDMAQWADPFYYHNFDQLHGLKSFIYDWYSGLGREIPGLCEPSLFDVMLYFIPRNMLLEFMSFMMMIKIMACAFTMAIFVRDINEEMPLTFRTMLSAGYGLCGFVLVNYTIPQWIDLAAVVPLVLMFAQRSLKTGKILGLSLSIFPIMILDYYFGIQTLLFVFLIGGAYGIRSYVLRRKDPKQQIPRYSRLLLGVILGLGLSAFSWLPDMAFSFSSARFGNGMSDDSLTGMYISILKNVEPAYLSRWFALLSLSFAAALVAIGLYSSIRSKHLDVVIFALVCIFMATAQLFVESIHLILHFGSYVDYPVRNGFMIYCIMAALAAGLYDRGFIMAGQRDKNRIFAAIAGSAFVILAVGGFRLWYLSGTAISDHTVLLITMFMMTVMAAVHITFLSVRGGRYSGACFFLWIAELLIFGTIMIGKPLYDSPYGNDPEQEGEFIRITDQLVEGFGDKLETGSDAATERIKNPDSSLNANYGEIMRRETLCGWTNLASPEQIGGATGLGYSNQFTRLLDSGGNIFSDTLLHITDIVSHKKLDDRLYEKVATVNAVTDHMTGESADYHLYKNRYEFPFAIPVRDISSITDSGSDTVGIVNGFAKAMGCDEDVAYVIEDAVEDLSEEGHDIKKYSIKVKGNKAVYFAGNCTDTDYYNTRIRVNGKIIPVPSIKENDNDLFPAHFNNNTVELGAFCDEDIVIDIDMDISDPDTVYSYYLYEIDLDVLQRLCDSMPKDIRISQGKRSLEIVFDNEDYKGILIPVSYSAGWNAWVNGVRDEVKNVNGLFMFIPAPAGNDTIKMSYFPPYMKAGIAMAIAAAVIIIMFFVYDGKRENKKSAADTVLGTMYIVAFVIAFMLIFIVPAGAALVLKAL